MQVLRRPVETTAHERTHALRESQVLTYQFAPLGNWREGLRREVAQER